MKTLVESYKWKHFYVKFLFDVTWRRFGTFIRNLTLPWRRPLSYRNQSIDLLRKSMDWFLYDSGPRHERVKDQRRRTTMRKRLGDWDYLSSHRISFPDKLQNAKIKNIDFLLIAHSENIIDDEELLLLSDLNRSTKLELPYWNYESVDLYRKIW